MKDNELLRRARKASELRTQQAEAVRQNDLLDFAKYLARKDRFVSEVMSKNKHAHVDVPVRQIEPQSKKKKKEAPPPQEECEAVEELKERKSWFSFF